MPTADALNTAVANAVGFLQDSREPHALLWLDVMHRRFGVPEFADALRRYDEVLATRPKDLPLLRVFRRIADRDNPIRLEDLEAVTHSSDRIVVSALYCDRLGLPDSFPYVLHKAMRAGGYYLTHALLALIWLQEYGSNHALPDALVDDVLGASARLVNEDPRAVTDLRLEAAAFLHLARQGARIDETFVGHVIAAQNEDGGWGKPRDGERGSDWHATILALLLLLHVKHGERSA